MVSLPTVRWELLLEVNALFWHLLFSWIEQAVRIDFPGRLKDLSKLWEGCDRVWDLLVKVIMVWE